MNINSKLKLEYRLGETKLLKSRNKELLKTLSPFPTSVIKSETDFDYYVERYTTTPTSKYIIKRSYRVPKPANANPLYLKES